VVLHPKATERLSIVPVTLHFPKEEGISLHPEDKDYQNTARERTLSLRAYSGFNDKFLQTERDHM
jgi:hypothetical protein